MSGKAPTDGVFGPVQATARVFIFQALSAWTVLEATGQYRTAGPRLPGLAAQRPRRRGAARTADLQREGVNPEALTAQPQPDAAAAPVPGGDLFAGLRIEPGGSLSRLPWLAGGRCRGLALEPDPASRIVPAGRVVEASGVAGNHQLLPVVAAEVAILARVGPQRRDLTAVAGLLVGPASVAPSGVLSRVVWMSRDARLTSLSARPW